MIRRSAALLAMGVIFLLATRTPAQVVWRAFPEDDLGRPRGQRLYLDQCEACHGAGPGHPGTAALAAKYRGQRPALLTERSDLTPATVIYFVRHGVSVMPAYRKTELSDEDLQALTEYLARNHSPPR